MKLLAPALAYFALAFAAGFALGLVRVPVLEPMIGERIAILIEAPILLALCALAARGCTRRFAVPAALGARLVMGALALTPLLVVELGVPWFVHGTTPAAYLAARDAGAVAVFGAMLLGFALLPALLLLLRDELLFSYGTLQLEPVQRATFGRRLTGTKDTLPGYRLGQLEIKSDEVVATSGVATHPIVHATGNPLDLVAGTVFRITAGELARADAYEVDDYARVKVTLASGTKAWVYAAAVAAAVAAGGAQATPRVDASTATYAVTGATESEVRHSLDTSPLSPDGRRRIGYTQADIYWRYQYRESGGKCRVIGVSVTLTTKTTLPRWDAPAGASRALRDKWDRFLGALTAHEQGHSDIGMAAAKKIEDALWRAPMPTTCKGYDDALGRIANRLFDAATKEQKAFDERTDHGALQGVRFP